MVPHVVNERIRGNTAMNNQETRQNIGMNNDSIFAPLHITYVIEEYTSQWPYKLETIISSRQKSK